MEHQDVQPQPALIENVQFEILGLGMMGVTMTWDDGFIVYTIMDQDDDATAILDLMVLCRQRHDELPPLVS